ncbi:MAG: hypothetical protein WD356_01035 [Pseudomonadales bacterium]
MSDFLDNIDATLEEIEEQLLSALDRFRHKYADSDYCTLDLESKETLQHAIDELDHNLEHSGDEKRLELRTERHEVIHARIVTVRHILNSEIPVACLHQAHRELEDSRDRLENRVLARRKKLEPHVTMTERRQQSDSLKELFNRDVGERELDRNQYLVTEQEERDLEDVDEFLDSGIYSASRELAMLANLIHRGATNKARPEQPKGRAVFEAKDLTSSLPHGNNVKSASKPTPETEPEPKKRSTETADKSDIARTPEEIRRKLEERKYQSAGKASFGAKDIEPEQPREYYGRQRETEKEEEEKENREDKGEHSHSGKAVFESRDLSRSPWEKK